MRRNMRIFILLALTFSVHAPTARAQSTLETIDYVQPRMVKIFGAGGIRKLHAYSTGFLVSPEGHIATIWSHVLDSDEVTVVLDNGRRLQAKVLGAEPQLDLAILKLEAEGLELSHFDLSKAVDATPGTRVLGFSNMFKVAAGDEATSVLHGIIAARTKLTTRRGAFETPYRGDVYVVDAITNNSGAGGGMLTTRDGRPLGMIGRELRNTRSNTWVNYAIPLSELKDVVGEIITGQYISREKQPDAQDNPGRYRPLDFGVVMIPDVLFRTPAYVDAIAAGSSAEKAGLKPDDLVLFVNDEIVQSCKALKNEMGHLEAGDRLRIVVRRGDGLFTAEMDVHRKTDK